MISLKYEQEYICYQKSYLLQNSIPSTRKVNHRKKKLVNIIMVQEYGSLLCLESKKKKCRKTAMLGT